MDNGENRFGRIVQSQRTAGGEDTFDDRVVREVEEHDHLLHDPRLFKRAFEIVGNVVLSLDNTRTTLLGHPMEMPLSPELLGRVGDIVVGHGQDRHLRDRAGTPLHDPGPLIERRESRPPWVGSCPRCGPGRSLTG